MPNLQTTLGGLSTASPKVFCTADLPSEEIFWSGQCIFQNPLFIQINNIQELSPGAFLDALDEFCPVVWSIGLVDWED